jgi:hypothetical protein
MKDNRLREIFLSDPYCEAYTKRKGKIYTYSSEQLATGSWSNEYMHCQQIEVQISAEIAGVAS